MLLHIYLPDVNSTVIAVQMLRVALYNAVTHIFT